MASSRVRYLRLTSLLGAGATSLVLGTAAHGAELTQPGFTSDGLMLPDANHSIYDNKASGVRINAGVALEGFAAGTHNINYGLKGHANGVNKSKSPAWWEAGVLPAVTAEYDIPESGTLFAGIDGSYNMTRGNGDGNPLGTTADHPEHARLDKAYLGWKSGNLFADSLGKNALSFSFGRQAFQIGDGFVLGDGFTNNGKYASYWTDPSKAFHSSAILSLDSHGWHADLFHLKASQYTTGTAGSNYGTYENTSLNGINVDYMLGDRAEFGGAYFHVYNSDTSARNGMDVYNLRAKGTPFESVPGLGLAGQYVLEHSKGQNYSTAHSWFGQASYAFQNTAWTPTLTYRHTEYSQNYDPLFNSFAGGWGTWYHGEVAGEYQISNSDMKIDMLKASIAPTDWVETGIIGYHFRGTGVQGGTDSGTFSNELNLYADWTLTPKLSVSTAYGIAFPGHNAKSSYGNKKAQVAEVFATYQF